MARPVLPSSREQVKKLTRLIKGRKRVIVCTHDHPDPDAMAGALCFCRVVEAVSSAKPRIVYGGVIGRAENRNMVRALDIRLWSVEGVKFRPQDAVMLVDTQPQFANHSVPADCDVVAVVDHHGGEPPAGIALIDIRPEYGAVTTIATEYLLGARVKIDARLATAICHGISTETQDLGRAASDADVAAFLEVFADADQPLLGRLRHPRVSVSFFAELDRAIRTARVVGDVVICHLGGTPAAEAAAEMADMLISLEDVHWVLCSGVYEDQLVLSVRASEQNARAGELLRRVVGEGRRAGGHDLIAGGSIPLDDGADRAEISAEITRRFLAELGHDQKAEPKPLLQQPGVRDALDIEAKKGQRK